MELLHLIFNALQILTCLLIVLSRNPIHSILFLILLFFESTAILILFNVEFISLLLIIVYVGAIAVLFLFVVMMLQVKSEPFTFFFFIVLVFSIFLFIIFENNLFLEKNYFSFNVVQGLNDYFVNFDSIKDIETLGQVLYNYYPSLFIIAGLLLLVALIGSIILTIDVNRSNQSNVIFRRLSRTDNFLSWFK
jgi:NADH-quinone oxidoreductase subunit J